MDMFGRKARSGLIREAERAENDAHDHAQRLQRRVLLLEAERDRYRDALRQICIHAEGVREGVAGRSEILVDVALLAEEALGGRRVMFG